MSTKQQYIYIKSLYYQKVENDLRCVYSDIENRLLSGHILPYSLVLGCHRIHEQNVSILRTGEHGLRQFCIPNKHTVM